jgi:glycosyltransferase involved in cell wall biosynthesis
MLVSVIIRSMDRATLAEALASVAAQTYAPIEIVVVNAKGGEHTALPGTCGHHSLLLANLSGPTLSRSAAANHGLDNARGGLVMFLDDDDLIHPEHIANLVAILEVTPHLIATYSGVYCIDAEGHRLDQVFGKPYDKTRLMSGNFIPIHSVVFRWNPSTRHCQFDETLEVYEDWDFWLQLAECGDFQFHPEFTAAYRLRSEGGFGVHGWGSDVAQRAMDQLVSKWQGLWSTRDIFALMECARESYELFEQMRK